MCAKSPLLFSCGLRMGSVSHVLGKGAGTFAVDCIPPGRVKSPRTEPRSGVQDLCEAPRATLGGEGFESFGVSSPLRLSQAMFGARRAPRAKAYTLIQVKKALGWRRGLVSVETVDSSSGYPRPCSDIRE